MPNHIVYSKYNLSGPEFSYDIISFLKIGKNGLVVSKNRYRGFRMGKKQSYYILNQILNRSNYLWEDYGAKGLTTKFGNEYIQEKNIRIIEIKPKSRQCRVVWSLLDLESIHESGWFNSLSAEELFKIRQQIDNEINAGWVSKQTYGIY